MTIVISPFGQSEIVAQCAPARTDPVFYDGAVHTNEFIVYPEGMTYEVEYALGDPLNVGTYPASVTIPSVGHIQGGTFVFDEAVTIVKADPEVSLEQTVAVAYDGLPHTNRFRVTPACPGRSPTPLSIPCSRWILRCHRDRGGQFQPSRRSLHI
jgi:hypothetical protein